MGRSKKMGELKRAAQQLGVTSTVLREQGWKTASPARIQTVRSDPPEWLITAREKHQHKRAKQLRKRTQKDTATRLGIQVRAVKERGIEPGDVSGLLAARPGWLVMEQERRRTQIEREVKDQLRSDLTDALVTSVHEVWLQELKYAAGDAEVGAIDARWAPEVDRAQREARQLIEELSAAQVLARIEREEVAAHEAGRYRAIKLAQRAFGGGAGG
ncbi:MAG: hypothetical protein GEU86_05390 [Actinophytocola sp.]|nr:hypothetical protein [Actinophytocola sp.]